ncbi:P63C domain-containing protein [Bacillus sp. FDAARGOS_1420]|uniref:P63C domain-containing protein n=1 Tax=unclassified Bacillus (in: firmicutes) TaxID=185979 RepID=UPI001C5AF8E1|nr:P63C domain-containing protein [Bacillus sp. FDAARGOS_1420]MBW3492536.1 P63C domain-containing protein [Bacillus sp. FDAARGOS_1420]
MEIKKHGYVEKCLKMPHAKAVGYFVMDEEKVYVAIHENGDCYFNREQQELVEKYYNDLSYNHFVEIPRAVVVEADLYIGDTKLQCSVLNDGRRVIKDTSLFAALDRKRKGETRLEGFPPIIGSKVLAALLMDMYPKHLHTITPFDVAQFNGKTGKWYDANTIPIICDIYMEAEKRELITASQQHVLNKAKILLRSLARVGITALIDEATNYQSIRGKDELQILLEEFISEELRPYSKEFHSEYFEQIFRIYGLPYDPTTQRRPKFFAGFTRTYVYDMLPPSVFEKLDEMNPLIHNSQTGRVDRKFRLFQHLSDDGIQYLRSHLEGLTSIMKLSSDKDDFKDKFKLVYADKITRIQKMKQDFYQITIDDV